MLSSRFFSRLTNGRVPTDIPLKLHTREATLSFLIYRIFLCDVIHWFQTNVYNFRPMFPTSMINQTCEWYSKLWNPRTEMRTVFICYVMLPTYYKSERYIALLKQIRIHFSSTARPTQYQTAISEVAEMQVLKLLKRPNIYTRQ